MSGTPLRDRLSALLLATLLLVATSGVALSRMTCLEAGHSLLSLGIASDCCPDAPASDEPTVSAECCAFETTGGTTTDVVSRYGHDLFEDRSVNDLSPLQACFLPTAYRQPAEHRAPPPRPLSSRLAVLGHFRI